MKPVLWFLREVEETVVFVEAVVVGFEREEGGMEVGFVALDSGMGVIGVVVVLAMVILGCINSWLSFLFCSRDSAS